MKMVKYFLYDEVVTHNKENDFWIVLHGNVLNLTPFILDRADNWNCKMEYLMAFGGKDLSFLFHKNGEPKTEISHISGQPRVLFPPILETATSHMLKTPCKLWSQDPLYVIGRLTSRERRLSIINTVTSTKQHMKVCDEDTIYDIQRKYKDRYNNHAGSYIWLKINGQRKIKLQLDKTLDENGLTENKDCGMELPPPVIWLFYTDDLTVA